METQERLIARELRAAGWSIKEIEVHLSVSRASVSPYGCETSNSSLSNRSDWSNVQGSDRSSPPSGTPHAREVRRAYQEEGRRFARERDATYSAGCMLYWAEDAKARNTLNLTNSGPELLRVSSRSSGSTSPWRTRRSGSHATSLPTHIEQQRGTLLASGIGTMPPA